MKKFLFAMMLTVLNHAVAWAESFQADTPEGITLQFTVSSEELKTCYVSSVISDRGQLGEVMTIPEEVNGYTVTRLTYTYSSPANGNNKGLFRNCVTLKTINLPNTITTIGEYAFNGCTALENITLPKDLKKISESMFRGCTGLREIVLPDSVETIEKSAFYGCTGLEHVTLPASLTAIGGDAFYGCTSQMQLTALMSAPITLTPSKYVFGKDFPTGLTLIVPEGCKAAYLEANVWKDFAIFEQGENIFPKLYTDEQGVIYTLMQTEGSNYYVVSGYTSDLAAEVVILSNINGCPVTGVGISSSLYYGFRNSTRLTKVTIPDGITTISSHAFQGCTALTEIVSLIQDPATCSMGSNSSLTSQAILRVPEGTKESYLTQSVWNRFFIYEMGEAVHPRTWADEQGLTYRLYANGTSFVYYVTGYTEELHDSITIPDDLDGVKVTAFEKSFFQNCTTIKWLHVPESLSITNKASAFSGCSFVLSLNQETVSGWSGCDFITSVELGGKVRSVGNEAFRGCLNLASVSFSDGIDSLSLGEKAFYQCTKLSEIRFPQVIKSIEGGCFAGCTSLQALTLPVILTSTGSSSSKGAFSDCTSLTSVTFDSRTESIGPYMFSGCTNLTDVVFPQGIERINDYAFANCSNLTNIVLPEDLTFIGYRAFQNCTSLTEVTTPNMIAGNNPYEGCTSVVKVTWNAPTLLNWFPSARELYIGKGVSSIGNGALSGNTALETIVVDTANAVYDSRGGCNAIIRTAGNELVRGCNTTVIPESVTRIADNAFSGCTELAAITLPAGLKGIGSKAFSGCTALQLVTSFVRKPYEISAFDGGTLAQATLTVPFGRTYFYQQASGWGFQTVSEMEGSGDETVFIQFADSVTKQICINRWDTNKDGEISLEEAKQVEAISRFSSYTGYASMTSFDELKYFVNVTSLDESIFRGCKNLTSVTLPDSLTNIGRSAFYGCESLIQVSIPERVSSIGPSAFYGCESLTQASLPKGLNVIPESAFWGCKSLTEVTLPQSLTVIESSAFRGCQKLSSISLPEGLTTIGSYAFAGCGMQEMTLPSTLTGIGDYALTGDVIHCLFATPFNIGSVISKASDVILYVPQGSEQAFGQADGWKNFVIAGAGYENTDWTEGQITVNVDEAGGLRLALIELDDEEITRLKIKGQMNSEDLAYLIDAKGKISNLESLDLSDVTLVYDGGCYLGGSSSGIGDTGFESSASQYFLTEEEREVSFHSVFGGPSGTNYYYYYGPNLVGVFTKPYRHIVMPRSVKKAASGVFSGLKTLQSVEFPGGMTKIDSYAFSGCELLPSMDFENIDSIYAGAFYNCKMLQVEHLDHVKYIGAGAFQNCKRLAENQQGVLDLSQFTLIPEDAFSGCINVKEVHLSDKATYIGKSAFSGCKQLTSITLPDSLTTLSSLAFYDCSMLQHVSYPESLQHIHYTSFLNTPWMNALPVENGVKYMGNIALCYDKTSSVADASLSFREGTAVIADEFFGSMEYRQWKNATKLDFPASLRHIGDKAFTGNNLVTLTLPEKLESIGEEAFYNSAQLAKLTLSEGLEYIGEYAFGNCPNLTIINYNAVRAEGKAAFSGCSSLEKVNVGNKVQLLPDRVFNNCQALTLVKCEERAGIIPLTIGEEAFSDCRQLARVSLPDGTIRIEDGAFANCSKLQSFALPSSIIYIGKNAFSKCESLTEVDVPEGIETIEDGTFSDCSSLQRANIPESVNSIGERAFSNCILTEIALPEHLTSIGTSAFSGCSLLEQIYLPSSLTTLGQSAFSGCTNLLEANLPGSLTEAGTGIFADCINLGKLTLGHKQPIEYQNFFYMTSDMVISFYGDYNTVTVPKSKGYFYENVSLYVPFGSKPDYEAAAYWQDFQNIVELPRDGEAEITVMDITNLIERYLNGNGDVTVADITDLIGKYLGQ